MNYDKPEDLPRCVRTCTQDFTSCDAVCPSQSRDEVVTCASKGHRALLGLLGQEVIQDVDGTTAPHSNALHLLDSAMKERVHLSR